MFNIKTEKQTDTFAFLVGEKFIMRQITRR